MSNPKDMLRLKADSDFFKTIAYLYSGNTLQMQENLKKCFEVAEQLQDEFFDFRVALLKNMSEYAGWKDLWISEVDTPISRELIHNCEKYHYYNHLAHIYVYSSDSDFRNLTEVDGAVHVKDVQFFVPQELHGGILIFHSTDRRAVSFHRIRKYRKKRKKSSNIV